ncbi:conserved hypothetical protein [Paraburkholderia ribeironis]|uniref:DUF6471 domain-containing protein n=1 Tax=Paraburkholderia ribeironis TaxID=1247936 RepID=A0A1N7SE70_9BURK|nr:DUF6471 domain-containing protein [Paraburkholderia ribeironis]SIT45686.1 conserved hypothetical protein [Paraburkholderia ribeironis]
MNWHEQAKQVLRAELVRRGVSVPELAQRLSLLGLEEAPDSLAVKISRGRFQLSFFLQCMSAIGADSVMIGVPRDDHQGEERENTNAPALKAKGNRPASS